MYHTMQRKRMHTLFGMYDTRYIRDAAPRQVRLFGSAYAETDIMTHVMRDEHQLTRTGGVDSPTPPAEIFNTAFHPARRNASFYQFCSPVL